jgi:3-oxoacyl-[acyl-carrier protein] reductase
MDLQIKDKLFVVTGGTSGFGLAITKRLVEEGAHVIVNARGKDRLDEIQSLAPQQIEIIDGDITTDAVIADIFRKIDSRPLSGVVLNAAGPPAMSFLETDLKDWDKAYEIILRWKVKFTHELLDKMLPQQAGNFLYIESASVKQPIENLVLSNSLRLAVVGFVKTLSQEVASSGITMNILAPGYHDTPAMERLYAKKSTLLGISPIEAKQIFENEVKVGHLGKADDFASLAAWLLSPLSKYITGQTISVDGGLVKGVMG